MMRSLGAYGARFPRPGWQRVALAALLVIPLILVVALTLMTPAWLLWPFLPDNRRKDIRALVGQLIDWIKVVAGGTPPSRPELDQGTDSADAA
jgi:hypothetical protein